MRNKILRTNSHDNSEPSSSFSSPLSRDPASRKFSHYNRTIKCNTSLLCHTLSGGTLQNEMTHQLKGGRRPREESDQSERGSRFG